MKLIEKELREATNKAIINVNEDKVERLIIQHPVHVQLILRDTHQADAVEYLPFVERKDAVTIEYVAQNMTEAYKSFQAIMFISSAASSMLQNLC